MAIVITLCTLALLALVVFVVSAPLRAEAERRPEAGEEGADDDGATDVSGSGAAGEAGADSRADEREQLEVARETKYREIRDAELDYRTGKLSERDYREIDAELRAEALEILDALEAEGARPKDASEARSRSRRTGPRRRPSSG